MPKQGMKACYELCGKDTQFQNSKNAVFMRSFVILGFFNYSTNFRLANS